MLPYNPGGHAAYQDSFVSDFLKFYPNPFVLSKDTWDYIVQFWYLDLSLTDTIMQECYSVFGPEPRLPSCMLRSYLLALKLKVTSITQWCRMLRETPLYAILSGFSFGDTPGVGTFYDFFSYFSTISPTVSFQIYCRWLNRCKTFGSCWRWYSTSYCRTTTKQTPLQL